MVNRIISKSGFQWVEIKNRINWNNSRLNYHHLFLKMFFYGSINRGITDFLVVVTATYIKMLLPALAA